MKNKSFAVIGLGQFGMTLAVTLAESDCDVLAIDDKEENIECRSCILLTPSLG